MNEDVEALDTLGQGDSGTNRLTVPSGIPMLEEASAPPAHKVADDIPQLALTDFRDEEMTPASSRQDGVSTATSTMRSRLQTLLFSHWHNDSSLQQSDTVKSHRTTFLGSNEDMLRVAILLLLEMSVSSSGELNPELSSKFPVMVRLKLHYAKFSGYLCTHDCLVTLNIRTSLLEQEGKPNVPYAMASIFFDKGCHCQELCSSILGDVVSKHSVRSGCAILLRLVAPQLFPATSFTMRKRVAKGAYAHVVRCKVSKIVNEPASVGCNETYEQLPAEVAMKRIDLPNDPSDYCAWHDVHHEIRILQNLQRCDRACRLYIAGVETDAICIVQRLYAASMKQWREFHMSGAPSSASLPLYLNVYEDALSAIEAIHSMGVAHFDIKADNFLLELKQVPAAIEMHNTSWRFPQAAEPLPFKLVLADFGEAAMKRDVSEGEDISELEGEQNRGTEYIKPPEMIRGSAVESSDRTTQGFMADAWASTCLLYELIFDEMLFHDSDWLAFVVRLANVETFALPEEKLAPLRDACAPLAGFIEHSLVPIPSERPKVEELRQLFHETKLEALSRLPLRYMPPEAARIAE